MASTVDAVLAQRLVRVICADCREPAHLDGPAARLLEPAGGPARAWRGAGCASCRGTGYRGRTGIYELLVMDEELRTALHQDASAGRLAKIATAKGMRLLREDGIRIIRAGETTAEEVLRVANV